MRSPSRLARIGATLLAALLVSCGGGSDDRTVTTEQLAAAGRERAQAVAPAAWVTVPAPVDPVLQNLAIPVDAVTKGMWSAVQTWPLNALHVTLLPNGKVLSYGTTTDGANQDGRFLDLWDPTQGFVAAGHTSTYYGNNPDSFCSTATFLGDGRLLIAGGNDEVNNTYYTPSTNTAVRSTATMADQRWYATMITLSDGRPLILGGMVKYSESMEYATDQAIAQGLASMTPEVFEGTAWRSLFGAYSRDAFGPDYLRASYPRAWVTPTGRVFGLSAETMWFLDPAGNGAVTVAGKFKVGPNVGTTPNVGATNSAVMFAPGRILVVGGNGSYNGDEYPSSNKATLIDITSGSAVLTEQTAMTYARRYPNTIVLPTGKVVVTGGTTYGNRNGANTVYASETWDPVARTWLVGASAAVYRGYHSYTTLMPNGTILSTGGGAPGPVTNLNAEVYYPPYLFRTVGSAAQLAPRPVMAAISGLSYASGATLQVDMTSSAAISQLVLIGTSGGTHSFNAGQRRIPLAFTQDTVRLTTTLPDNFTAPPGYYQVIAIDASGVPSRGVIVAIGQGVSAPPVPTTPYTPPDLSASINAPVIAAGGTASFTVSTVSGTTYSWTFGDGSAATAYSASPSVTHAYATAGVYGVTLSAKAANGSVSTRSFVQAVTAPATAARPAASGATALETRSGASTRLWTVNPDNDSVTVIDTVTRAATEIAVGVSPRSVAVAPDGRLWVTNKGSASISVIGAATLAVAQTIALPRASQPHGLAFAPGGASAYVVLEATGQLLKLNPSTGAQLGAAAVGANARHVSVSGDAATVLVSRFITPPLAGESTATITTNTGGGEVLVVTASTMAVAKTVTLRHSDKTDSETQGSGIPNYLGAAVISPDGKSAWVPSKQDNVKRGALRNAQPLNFQNTVRAISSRIDLPTLAEDYAKRIDHDNSSIGSAAAFHPTGAYLFVALETSRQVAVVDAAGGRELLKVDVGRAPQGLSVSADGKTLYVQNFMDRSVSLLDLTPLITVGELRVPLLATVATVAVDKLAAPVLAGKQFFYDARDPRLARDSYLSCASCHDDAGNDGRVWDFTGFGEGLRASIPLRGRAGTGHGFMHWSANFDEVQDFEKQIRDLAGGTGLMTDAQYNAGTRNQPLGDPKAGVSVDLDALAAYLASLQVFDPSPWRNADGSLTTAAAAGRSVFATAGCLTCHGGAGFTNSSDATRLKNIGTLKAASGKRLGATLTGIDVPTLRDVWSTGPYLHDGSAATLSAAVTAHGGVSLSATDLSNLVEYLRQIGSEESGSAAPVQCATESGTCVLPPNMLADVYFGAAGRTVVKSAVGGSIACTNAAFGSDPTSGLTKACSFVPNPTQFSAAALPAGAIACAAEGGYCAVPGGAQATIYFGINNGYVARSGQSGRVFCDNSVFGDPYYGVAKACSIVVTRQGAFDNLALRKVATQSSTLSGADASRAVDGRTDGRFAAASVTSTGASAQEWWQVDLGAIGRVENVRVWNRSDAGAANLANFVVLLSPTDMTGRPLSALMADPTVTVREVASLPVGVPSVDVGIGAYGRFVRVQLKGTANLTLAEVQVYGVQGGVWSTGRTATQSSTEFGGLASRVVDGNTDGYWPNASVSRTLSEAQPWWQVDLGTVGRIDTLQLWNRTDCCASLGAFTVFVSSTDMTGRTLAQLKADSAVASSTFSTTAGMPTSIPVPMFQNGRYVRVQLAGTTNLFLAEVQVVGQGP